MSDESVKVAAKVEALIGWRPPVIYSVAEDEVRVATQEDIDQLQRIANAYHKLRHEMQRALEARP